ncbi:MAG: hypothetical protein HFF08_09240 [Oscillospiraceae bacterium]|nr:hypothetical protein [Oscillospiraceae bacterium]
MDEYEEYEEYEEENDGGSKVNKILLIVICLLVIAVGVVGFFLIRNLHSKETHIGLALTEDELAAALDDARANAGTGNIALRFKNNAYSEDGQSFSCYIMNSERNAYDMFLTIYGDEQLSDELFSSGLVAPGRGFDQIKLNRALDQGTHMVYVVLTQVDTDEEGVQTVVGQTSHAMDFIVS